MPWGSNVELLSGETEQQISEQIINKYYLANLEKKVELFA